MIDYTWGKDIVPQGKTPITVTLDKKVVGEIRHVKGGFQYFPKGGKTGGEVSDTVAKVKRSLEE